MQNQSKITTLFFDFYALNLLDYFAGDASLNHRTRGEKITAENERVIDCLYDRVHRCLLYSVLQEFRHFYTCTYETTNDSQIAKIRSQTSHRIYRKYNDTRIFERFLDGKVDKFNFKYDLHVIYDGYMNVRWKKCYGGKRWGQATAFLLKLPKTKAEKIIWIDRVLDLYHNSGPLLNKTEFYALSKRKFKRREQHSKYQRNAMNYRRYAETITDLSQYASSRVKKLVVANLNMLPEMIR